MYYSYPRYQVSRTLLNWLERDVSHRESRIKGLSEIVPTFETVFVLGCHYAVSPSLSSAKA